MPSKFLPFDDFIRNKEQEIPANSDQMDLHWQQFQMLVQPGSSVKPNTTRRLQPLMKYAATVVAGIIVISFYFSKGRGTEQTRDPFTKQESGSVNANLIRVPVKKNPNSGTVSNSKPTTDLVSNRPLKQKSFEKRTVIAAPASKSDHAFTSLKPDSIQVLSNKKVFEQFYRQLEKPAEVFNINTHRDTTIQCSEGTSVFIPAHSFETVSGVAVSGQIELAVQEFYSFADIIGNKLNTESNGNLLSSGGMLNIVAKANNQELKLKSGAAIDLNGQKAQASQVIQTDQEDGIEPRLSANSNDTVSRSGSSFSGGTFLNWTSVGQQQFFIKEKLKYITIVNFTDNPYEVSTYKNGTKTIAKFKIPFNSEMSCEQMQYELEKRYGRYYDRIKVKREWTPLFKNTRINRWSTVTKDWYDSGFVGDSISISVSIATRLKLITRKDSLRHEAQFKKQYEEALKNNKAYSQFLDIRDKYSFRISNLGWINCDRFNKYPLSKLTDFYVDAGAEFEETYMHAMLVLKDENAAMQGHWSNGKIYFSKIPAGQQVSIVCIGAKSGKAFGCIQKLTVRKNEVPKLQFTETDPEKFRQQLSYFGTVTRQN
jgi:hypothetical protein